MFVPYFRNCRKRERGGASLSNAEFPSYTSQDSLQGYIFWPFLSQLKNREEFEGGLEKSKGKRGKKKKKRKRVIKYTLKYLYEA